MLGVDLDGSRRIQKDRLDDHRDDQRASDTESEGKASRILGEGQGWNHCPSGYSPRYASDREVGLTQDSIRAALRHTLLTRRTGWWLATALAALGALGGVRRLGWAGLTQASLASARIVGWLLSVGWFFLLLGGIGLALSLALSNPRGRRAARWLRSRLMTKPWRWGIAVGGLVAVLGLVLMLVVVVLPPRFTANHAFENDSDELKAQSDIRTTLLQGVGALLILTSASIGAAVTLRQIRVSQGQLQATREQLQYSIETTREQLRLTEQGQITDRFTRAVDQLGSEHLDIRVGGIFALERIARDSPHDRATIEEVLTAFLRSHTSSPIQPATDTQATTPPPPPPPPMAMRRPHLPAVPPRDKDMADQPKEEVKESPGPASDVQAALTVLGRRMHPPDGLRVLDLVRVNLPRAQLAGADFQGADLSGANLQSVQLSGANLQDALLERANLQGADLGGANLQGAQLNSANLRGATLESVYAPHAYFWFADLQDADLDGVDLQGASLLYSNLQAAVLWDANLRGADLLNAQLQQARLLGADLHGARLDHTNLRGAWADEYTTWEEGWSRETAEARGVQYAE